MKTIFVSSTFKDMHFERDAIQEITLPKLRKEAMEYGENVSFCDLRWGINTGDLDSEEGSHKVLDVCLDEIDRCKPPMVVILGDRYGWIPAEELTTSAADRKNIDKDRLKRDIELEDLQISVTALEIAYGALSTPEKYSQALFYFRRIITSDCPDEYTAEDSEHQKKLDHLKTKIDALTGGRITYYDVCWDGEKLEGVTSFAEMLAEDIAQVLRPEWKKKELLTPFDRERLTHWSFIEEKNAMFSARGALVQQYYDDLTQNGKHFLAIKAPSGTGKSMLFSNLALKLRDTGYDVVPFMSGLTAESNDSADILRNTIYYMEDLLGFSHMPVDLDSLPLSGLNGSGDGIQGQGIEKLRERLYELCVACRHAGKHVVIMVDAVDQLATDDNRDNLIFIPERLSENVKFVMTCLPELILPGYACTTISPMDDAEKRLVISGVLGVHHRQIEDSVFEKMLELEASSNPLFLSLLIQRLLMMNHEDFFAINAKKIDAMKAISERQMEVLHTCPDSLQDMSAALLTEAGGRIQKTLVRKVAEYLAVSRHGLRREDLAALLGNEWSELDFAHFVAYMNESFMRRDDGRFDFSHKCIREGFLSLCTETNSIHKEILNHMKSLPDEDCVKKQEIVYHCIQADEKDYFLEYIDEITDREEQLKFAAKDVFLHSMEDHGDWICAVMSCKRKSFNFCHFVYTIFVKGTPHQLAVSQKILKANIAYAEENTESFSVATVSTAYNQYAYVCGELGGKENLSLSLDYYHKALIAAEKAAEEYEDIDFREFRALRYSNYAYALTLFGGIDHYNEAIALYQKAIELKESFLEDDKNDYVRAMHLAASYDSIGALLSGFASGFNQDKALIYLEKALELRKNFRHAMSIEQYAENIINSYIHLANLYFSKASVLTLKDIQKAINYYDQAMIFIESLKDSHDKPSHTIRLMSVALSLGNVYVSKDKGAYNGAKARENYQKVIHAYNAMDPDYVTDRMREYYAYALNGYGLTILLSQDIKQAETALELFQQSIAVLEELEQRYQTAVIQTQLFTVYSNFALQCSKVNASKFLKLGIEYCEKAIKLAQNIADSDRLTTDYHEKCVFLYSTIASLNWKQKKIFESLKWTVRAIKSLFGKYSFDVNDETKISRAYDEKINKKSHTGGILFGIISLICALISVCGANADSIRLCLYFATWSAVLTGLNFGIYVSRLKKEGESGKHVLPSILGIVSIVLMICSLCMLIIG